MESIRKSTKYIFIQVFTFLSTCVVWSQDDIDIRKDVDVVQSTLFYYSFFDVNLDYYAYDSDLEQLAISSNGTIALSDTSLLNIELSVFNNWNNGQYSFTPGDFSFTYTKNFYATNFKSSGFQGWAPSLKLIIPTGRAEEGSGSDNWILEPQVLFGWLLKDERFFITNRARINFSLGQTGEAESSRTYLRYELRGGFENEHFWVSLFPDFRYVFDNSGSNLFMKYEGGCKFNEQMGLGGFFTHRILGSEFFTLYVNLNFYYILN